MPAPGPTTNTNHVKFPALLLQGSDIIIARLIKSGVRLPMPTYLLPVCNLFL